MENYVLDEDLRLCCLAAASFPDGVKAAFERLHATVPDHQRRRLFGLSWPDGKGGMSYKAAVTESYPGEAAVFGAEAYMLQKGTFTCLLVKDFMKDIPSIGRAFAQLVAAPGVDPSMGVEEYLDDTTVRCMVRNIQTH